MLEEAKGLCTDRFALLLAMSARESDGFIMISLLRLDYDFGGAWRHCLRGRPSVEQ